MSAKDANPAGCEWRGTVACACHVERNVQLIGDAELIDDERRVLKAAWRGRPTVMMDGHLACALCRKRIIGKRWLRGPKAPSGGRQ